MDKYTKQNTLNNLELLIENNTANHEVQLKTMYYTSCKLILGTPESLKRKGFLFVFFDFPCIHCGIY